MAWLESHQALGQHPKLRKLAALLGIGRPQAVGHCFYLWWWCLDYAQDGSLARYDAVDIALAAEWGGDPVEFVQAMERAGFLDRGADGLAIHDWWEYAGRLIERRKHDAERKRVGRLSDVQRTSGGRPADGARTAHVQTQQTQQTQQTAAIAATRATREPHQRQIPAGFTPGESALKRAGELGWTPDGIALELDKFRDYHIAKGSRFKNWDQAFLNWLRRAPEFAPPKVVPIRANGAGRSYDEFVAGLDQILTGENA